MTAAGPYLGKTDQLGGVTGQQPESFRDRGRRTVQIDFDAPDALPVDDDLVGEAETEQAGLNSFQPFGPGNKITRSPTGFAKRKRSCASDHGISSPLREGFLHKSGEYGGIALTLRQIYVMRDMPTHGGAA